jgi:hypothetical protein
MRRRVNRQAKFASASLPAPIGGLNARDAVSMMAETDAITLDNWFPLATSVDLRNGYSSWNTFTGNCETVIEYQGASATGLFAAVNNAGTRSIFTATSSGAISVPVVGGAGSTVQAVTSTRYDYVNVGTTGGQFLLLCNGADPMLQYNGSAWSVASGITGITGGTQTIFSIIVHASRVWMLKKNTFSVWYLGTSAITGAATELNLATLFPAGGSLACAITWGGDTNSQLDAFIGFVSTEGEVVVFTGSDPSSDATWARVAYFKIGRPVTTGNRCWARYASDALIMTADGVIPASKAVALDRAGPSISVTDKIRNLVTQDFISHASKFGWSLVVHPAGNKLILNVPTVENSTARQYVMNTQTGAWTRFTGWNAFCFAVQRDTLYFGGNGILVKADTGTGDGGVAVQSDAKQAFSYFGSRGQQKKFNLMRPVLSIDGEIQLGLDINVDYADVAPGSTVTVNTGSGDPWSVAWSVAWGGASFLYRAWNSLRGVGFCAAPRIRVQSSDVRVSWSASDFSWEPGGLL